MIGTMKPTTQDQKRSALVLATTRKLFADRLLDGPSLHAVGIEFDHGGSLGIEDNRLCPLVLEAGRAPGFGDQPVDAEIRSYLDVRHGMQRWQQERPLYAWQRGGGDEKLEALLIDQDAAEADREKAEAAMWAAWDEKQRVFAMPDVDRSEIGLALIKGAVNDLDKATKVWEKAIERQQPARGVVLHRQRYLQEVWMHGQAAKRA